MELICPHCNHHNDFSGVNLACHECKRPVSRYLFEKPSGARKVFSQLLLLGAVGVGAYAHSIYTQVMAPQPFDATLMLAGGLNPRFASDTRYPHAIEFSLVADCTKLRETSTIRPPDRRRQVCGCALEKTQQQFSYLEFQNADRRVNFGKLLIGHVSSCQSALG